MKKVYKFEYLYSKEREEYCKAHKLKYRLYDDKNGNLEAMDFFYKTNREDAPPVLPEEVFYKKDPLWMIYEYTKKDCMNADWILMAGVSSKIEGVNYHHGYEDSFYAYEEHVTGYERHFSGLDRPMQIIHTILWQRYPAIIKSDRKPDGKFHLFSDNYPYVFCDPYVKESIENSDLKGVTFLPVYWKRRYKQQKSVSSAEKDPADILIPKSLMGTANAVRGIVKEGYDHTVPGTLCENVFQMSTEHVIPQSEMDFSEVWKAYPCKTCGSTSYSNFITHPIVLKKGKLDPSIDMYMTESIFDTFSASKPKVIISNRFYRFLLDHGMTRGAHFMPVLYELD